jgi:hypothetical protein
LFSGRVAEFRALGLDAAVRQDSTGTFYGPPPEYRGARFWLQPAGDDDRSTRVAVKARRNNVDEFQDDNIGDSITPSVAYRARRLNFPG